jgi:pimeloyl-ACP methyl ester carboxylesterase
MRPLLFVHGVYHASWCFAEHLTPHFADRGHAVHLLDLPLDASRFSPSECAEAVARAFAAITPAPVVIGHSLGGRAVRAAMGCAPIDHAILLSRPTNAQLTREALRVFVERPLEALRALCTGRQEALYHDARFVEDAFFARTLSRSQTDVYLARIRRVRYPRWALARSMKLGMPERCAPRARIDLVVGGLDRTCRDTRPERGERLHVIEGAPHDLMLGPSWPACAAAIARIVA